MCKPTSTYAVTLLLAALFILSALPAMGAGITSEVIFTFKNTMRHKWVDAEVIREDISRDWQVEVPPNSSLDIKTSVKAPKSGYANYLFYIGTVVDRQESKGCYLRVSNTNDGTIVHHETSDCQFGPQATFIVEEKMIKGIFTVE